jgi:thioredoxin-related protein
MTYFSKIIFCFILIIFIEYNLEAQVYLDMDTYDISDTISDTKSNSIQVDNATIKLTEQKDNILLYMDSLLKNQVDSAFVYDTISQIPEVNKYSLYINVDTSLITPAEENIVIYNNSIVNRKIESNAFVFQDIVYTDFIKLADSTNKNYFIQFTAEWCGPCKMMDKLVFSKSDILSEINSNYLAYKIDIDAFDGVQVTQDYGIKSIPATIIFDSKGNVLKRIEGYQSENMFLDILKRYR